MTSTRDSVTIQEPPLRELNKKRSCLKRTCFTGCGCIGLFFLASVLFLHLISGPKQTTVKDLPREVKDAVPLYDVEAVDHITYIPGAESNQLLEKAAYIPKVILAPMALTLQSSLPENDITADGSKWQQFVSFLQQPVADHRDVYLLQWNDLTAKPSFVFDYYVLELENNAFTVSIASDTQTKKQLTFYNDTINGTIDFRDNAQESGTDTIIVTIQLPEK